MLWRAAVSRDCWVGCPTLSGFAWSFIWVFVPHQVVHLVRRVLLSCIVEIGQPSQRAGTERVTWHRSYSRQDCVSAYHPRILDVISSVGRCHRTRHRWRCTQACVLFHVGKCVLHFLHFGRAVVVVHWSGYYVLPRDTVVHFFCLPTGSNGPTRN